MRKIIVSAIAGLVFLTGCEASKAPTRAKWEGPSYRLTTGAAPAKPGPAGLTLPPIYFTANPQAVQTRTNLAMRIDTSGGKRPGKITGQILLMPTDISGSTGAVNDAYLNTASAELAKMLSAYCMKGKTKVKVALIKSSIMMSATEVQVDNHRLSDWMEVEVDFVNPHPKC